MRKPVIGITANVITLNNGAERSAVSTDYINTIEQAGGIPMVLPVVFEKNTIRQQAEFIDGLLLSGGYDVDPLLFGEQPVEGLGYVDPDRDAHEMELTKIATLMNIPVLGICRGIQLINIAFGGTIYQDVRNVPGGIKHMQNARNNVPTHTVEIAAGSLLYSVFGHSVTTNSFHHQAIKDLAPGFIATARTLDGVIEGIEQPDSQFLVGVQWHPEMMAAKYPGMLELLKKFISAAKSMD